MNDDLVKRARDRETRTEFDDWGILDELADRIEALTAENAALREAAIEAAKQFRIIAGMDLIGASATAYNAARDLEAALSRKAAT